jgi:hypothetical protein
VQRVVFLWWSCGELRGGCGVQDACFSATKNRTPVATIFSLSRCRLWIGREDGGLTRM